MYVATDVIAKMYGTYNLPTTCAIRARLKVTVAIIMLLAINWHIFEFFLSTIFRLSFKSTRFIQYKILEAKSYTASLGTAIAIKICNFMDQVFKIFLEKEKEKIVS